MPYALYALYALWPLRETAVFADDIQHPLGVLRMQPVPHVRHRVQHDSPVCYMCMLYVYVYVICVCYMCMLYVYVICVCVCYMCMLYVYV
jgi:hypothetical protein